MYKARFIINMLLARRVCGWSARHLLKPRPIRTAFKSSTRAAPLMSVVDKESMDYVDVDTELAAPVEDVVLGEEVVPDEEPEKDPMAIEGRISDRRRKTRQEHQDLAVNIELRARVRGETCWASRGQAQARPPAPGYLLLKN